MVDERPLNAALLVEAQRPFEADQGLCVVEGRPGVQLVYNTDNKAIGPLSLVIGATKQPDIAPTFDHRQDVNLLYWRHQGRAYALVGQADIGYLWGIANDVAWQLDASFKYDASLITEVEVSFTVLGPKRTRVDFEHRNLDRFGADATRLRKMMGDGWAGILESFTRAAAS